MDIKQLWIGDSLRIIATGEVGSFEGIYRDLLMVKIGEKIRYLKVHELEEGPALDAPTELEVEGFTPVVHQSDTPFDPIIDLHLDKLPDFENSKWPHPVDYQSYRCRIFIERSIALKIPQITIIHGVGKGILKEEVLHLLDRYQEVNQITAIQQGGAVRVEFALG